MESNVIGLEPNTSATATDERIRWLERKCADMWDFVERFQVLEKTVRTAVQPPMSTVQSINQRIDGLAGRFEDRIALPVTHLPASDVHHGLLKLEELVDARITALTERFENYQALLIGAEHLSTLQTRFDAMQETVHELKAQVQAYGSKTTKDNMSASAINIRIDGLGLDERAAVTGHLLTMTDATKMEERLNTHIDAASMRLQQLDTCQPTFKKDWHHPADLTEPV